MTGSGLIDVHHHLVPAAYRTAIDAATAGSIGGIPQPAWDLESMLVRMGALGIARSVLSISAPALAPIDLSARALLGRECNVEMASLAARHPDAIGGFGVLPMPDVDASIAEIAHVLDDLRLDGVGLLTNYGGRYLGHPDFEPVLAELDRRRAVVHVHPNLPPPMPDAQLLLPAPVLEFTFDTTRMVADLIATETLSRYEGMTLILSHLGGTLPWVAWRLSMLDDFPSRGGGRREPVRDQLRRVYYDVALSSGPEALRLACDLVGPDRLLYGSDTPFGPAGFVDANTRGLADAVGRTDLVGATRDNAIRLLG